MAKRWPKPKEITLTLPYPPTINHYYGRGRNGRMFIKKKGLNYRVDVVCAVVMLVADDPMTVPLRVRLDIYPPDRRKRDIDNIQKACLDAMEKAGVYVNDNQIKDLHSIMHEPIIDGKVIVTLQEVDNAK